MGGRTVMEEMFKDKKPHLLRLLVRPDNTFEISIDHTLVNHGTLLDSFTPPVNPPAEIDDPNDSMPADWDEREKIPDPEATKPGDWEAPLIDNPVCTSVSGCGPWKQPMIDNPAYKGKWFAPMINNPGYKGKWKPAKIPNPDYFHDPEPFKMTAIAGIGIELWTMSDSIYFDNILVTDSLALADSLAKETFDLKMSVIDAMNGNIFRRILDYSNKNPWLYAVYVVLVGLPTVLIITFCCSGSGEKSEGGDKSSLNDPKKTDEPQEDDEVAEEAADEETVGQEEAEGDGSDEDEEEEEEDEPPTTRSQTRKRRPRKEL